jgi:hypothetical protein
MILPLLNVRGEQAAQGNAGVHIEALQYLANIIQVNRPMTPCGNSRRNRGFGTLIGRHSHQQLPMSGETAVRPVRGHHWDTPNVECVGSLSFCLTNRSFSSPQAHSVFDAADFLYACS